MSAISSSSHPLYATSDLGSGRCRMSKSTMLKWKILRLGMVAKLRLFTSEWSYSVLCTVWPDNNEILSENNICIDSTVFMDVVDGKEIPLWTECNYEVSLTTPAYCTKNVTQFYIILTLLCRLSKCFKPIP